MPSECLEKEIEDGILRLSLDYRTRDVRSDYEHRQKMMRYTKYDATNTLQYRWHKLKSALIGGGTKTASR